MANLSCRNGYIDSQPAAIRRVELDFAVHASDSLFHAANPHAVELVRLLTGVDPNPVVFITQVDFIRLGGQTEPYLRRVGMLRCIGQRLLDNPVQSDQMVVTDIIIEV